MVSTLAYHYWQGEQWEQAAEYSLRAGAGALEVYALREAIGHFDRAGAALEKVPDAPPEKVYDAILGWAEAAFKFKSRAEI